RSLVERVNSEARVPVFAHLDGICHTYIHADADPTMAKAIVLNAKLRRTGICGATETLLVHQKFDRSSLKEILDALSDQGCKIRGDNAIVELDSAFSKASQNDWSTEYLDAILSVKTVASLNAAIEHVQKYGSNHTEAIITNDSSVANEFIDRIDSAIVMHNTSTQFADGGEFGMGAEIGIATGKMHARGPVGIDQLTTFKYVVRGQGQIRPK
ncbi:MAG: glutamate-5-semialdehyde dehydrogenase, partial [Planctomycetota bacterium]